MNDILELFISNYNEYDKPTYEIKAMKFNNSEQLKNLLKGGNINYNKQKTKSKIYNYINLFR